MSELKFKRGKGFKVDDTFFKDNFDITDIEDNIYNQMAKTMARNVDIELAKTPLVDILTGYTRYKEAEYELQQKENIIKEAIKYINHYENIRAYYSYSEDGYEEYNYDDDFKEEIINLLKGEMENE